MKKLRPHQIEALKLINNNQNGIIHLPTGTGKTFIQATSIVQNIDDGFKWAKNVSKKDVPVFVILSPRILLSNQIFDEIKNVLITKKIDFRYLIVHSGFKKENIDDIKLIKKYNLNYHELITTVKTSDIIEQYKYAKLLNIPLFISSTYDSAIRIHQSGIPIYFLLSDEAQYLVSEEFNWIPKNFNAKHKYYFTATLKTTSSSDGNGMNNSSIFGNIIYSKSPAEMIKSGDILRPRIHVVKTIDADDLNEADIDANNITSAFIEHSKNIKFGAKMLVVVKGSDNLNNIVNHPLIKYLKESRPKLKIFDISSAFSPRINGVEVTRDDFLLQLKNLKDEEEAIILHIDILTEGIDVPGITGVMIMKNLKLSKFLQTLGRATRLHSDDRKLLYNNLIKSNELYKFKKPYAWIIIPTNDFNSEDLKDRLIKIIHSLRTYEFNASEDVIITQDRGLSEPEELESLNDLLITQNISLNARQNTLHEIELEIFSEKLGDDFKNNIKSISDSIDMTSLINKTFKKL